MLPCLVKIEIDNKRRGFKLPCLIMVETSSGREDLSSHF